jgi:hypothetical protein
VDGISEMELGINISIRIIIISGMPITTKVIILFVMDKLNISFEASLVT